LLTYRTRTLSESLRAIVRRGRPLAPFAVALVIVLVLVGAAVVIARVDGSEEIANDARVQIAAQSIVNRSAIVQSEVRESLIVGEAVGAGVYSPNDLGRSANNIGIAVANLGTSMGVLIDLGGGDDLAVKVADLSEVAVEVASAIEDADLASADGLAENEFAAAFEAVVASADEISRVRAGRIAAVNDGLGTVATAARYVSGLLIPALAALLFLRFLSRDHREAALKAELTNEQMLRRKKDAFLAAASHHINTPLAAVVGFAELLRDRTRDFSAGVRSEVTELLAIQVQETSHVVDDLLLAARHDLENIELIREEVQVRDILEEATADWASTSRLRLTIEGDGVVLADRRWLNHALRNLLRNAAAVGGNAINVRVSNGSRRVVVEIADDGPPIAADDQERIFELYYSRAQIQGLAPSLGLGLSVARRVTQTMGGSLRYLRLGQENVFEMSLPTPAGRTADQPSITPVTIDPQAEEPTLEEIKQVIIAGGPEIVYQPIVDMRAHHVGQQQIVGYEALSRFGSHTPPIWFESAAIAGLRLDLELACISAALEGFTGTDEGLFLAVNLSDTTLHSSRLREILAPIDQSRLVLELSEAASIRSYETTRTHVETLAANGIRLAIDDVGSGDIDLWHITRLGATVLKIDISLVQNLDSQPRHRALIRALVAMAEDLRIMVIAEGVEQQVEHDQLMELGVRFGQGYLYGRPGPIFSGSTATGRTAHLRVVP
jgi:EAL domain-containing protein (putative c-di-GMP-specific phosphodiesterase class I)/signal transduction histidine kinase